MRLKNTTKYDEMIHLSHPVSKTHPQMKRSDRAAQFSPFAALTGHEAAIKETARLTDERAELDENQKSILNEKLQIIMERLEEQPDVSITYFQPDEKKEGGSYVTVKAALKRMDRYNRVILTTDGRRIPIDEIYKIELPEEE